MSLSTISVTSMIMAVSFIGGGNKSTRLCTLIICMFWHKLKAKIVLFFYLKCLVYSLFCRIFFLTVLRHGWSKVPFVKIKPETASLSFFLVIEIVIEIVYVYI